MIYRKNLFTIAIWWAVIGGSVWIGGTVYMMSVINPQWSNNPPESVKHFFTQTSFNKYIWNFFGPPFMLLRTVVPQLLSLIVSWKSKIHKQYLLITFTCTIIAVLFTLFYIYPINNVLMFQAGGQNTPEAIRQMVSKWIIADRMRFFINFFGFIFLLKAFRLPVEKN
jgi:anthrone oxygenase-like protein